MYRIASITLLLLVTTVALAEDKAELPSIKQIKKIQPSAKVFDKSSRKKPLELRSAKDAADYFADDQLKKLKKEVDFDKQIVLVFAWRGSGQDKLSYNIMESNPEQIAFVYKPGRTRDLRPHVYVYALRSNVKWSPK
jgi:hypothetical protein